MEERLVNTWEEFETQIANIQLEANANPKSHLLFRGQENSCWPLKTTLDRNQESMLYKDYYRIVATIRPQIETLTGQEWPIREYPEVAKAVEDYSFDLDLWSGRSPAYGYMAYLRHHGFPSPLLDWTRSPYIAGYFAFSKADPRLAERVSVFVFSEIKNKVSGNEMDNLYLYGPYVKTHRRHVLQQSEYTLCARFDSEWRFGSYEKLFDDSIGQQGICLKFTIPSSERAKVLRQLDKYNLNEFSLFESEDGLMKTLAFRHLWKG